MYKENISDELAAQVLGSDYIPNLAYTIISDIDKFVVVGYSANGTRVFEQELEQDRNAMDSYIIDDVTPTTVPRKKFPIVSILLIITLLTVTVGVIMCILIAKGVISWIP